MKVKYFLLTLLYIFISNSSFGQNKRLTEYKIQIALILDVSGSMDGLLLQAKGQFWRMLNELSKVEKNKVKPSIQIAIATYGNLDNERNGFFKLFTPLTTDLDLVSDNLFNLKTYGNNEFCGFAIQNTIDSLNWSENKNDLKIIFIAGNEGFNQGMVDYVKVCKKAVKQNIIVNTIFCGTKQDGIDLLWENGATIAKGKYTYINQDSILKQTETIWDNKINYLNNQLNNTYLPYGMEGEKNLKIQLKQDENAEFLGKNFMRERIFFKISDLYINSHWDLIDAYHQDSTILMKLGKTEFPTLMQPMSIDEKKKYIDQVIQKRELYSESIEMYYKLAQEYLKVNSNNEDSTLTLDSSIIKIMKEQANKIGYIFK